MDKNKIWNVAGAFTGVIFVVLVAIGSGIAGDRIDRPTHPVI